MTRATDAPGMWQEMESKRSSMMSRFEVYASLTVQRVLLPVGFDRMATDQTTDYQSIGAAAVGHLTNQVMLTMFAPSRPIFRVQPTIKTTNEYTQMGLTEADVAEALAEHERAAQRKLDSLAQRPKLYNCVRKLIVLGNDLLVLAEDHLRSISIRNWCVKRTQKGQVHTLIIRETLCFDELEDEVQEYITSHGKTKYLDESEASHYLVIKRERGGKYTMDQWVDGVMLPHDDFGAQYPNYDECPYQVLVWNLEDESDYGTGLVEECRGDLQALSILAEAVVDGAVLAAEHRWGIDPSGQTSADDLEKSKNGSVIAARKDDVNVITAGTAPAVQATSAVMATWEARISRLFLMARSVTRNAERVTAEEIRLLASELETSLGGVYSSLAATLQKAVARWLLKQINVKLKQDKYDLEIVTGLEALSRNGDLDQLRLALQDAAMLAELPQALQDILKLDDIFKFIGAGRMIALHKFVMNQAERQANQSQSIQQAAAATGAIAGAEAQAQGTA